MIPKLIHFCWLSGDEYPELVKRCINSWKIHMPDYEIICWTKDKVANIDNPFMNEAISCRKWAFASDYIRMYALYNYGGIYLDSDVFVRSDLSLLMGHKVFSGIEYCISSKERTCNIEAAVIGAEPRHPFILECLNSFTNRKFLLEDGKYDQTIIPEIVADIAERNYGFKRIPETQILNKGICIYSPEIIAHAYLEYRSSKNCVAIHLCEGGWYRSDISISSRLNSLMHRLYKYPLKTIYMLYWKHRFKKEMNSVK